MNVYQKILVKLYEVTGGKDSSLVDFRELLKEVGFYPSYDDIFKYMSQQGWITESGREGIVSITHWGVKEAKKVSVGASSGNRSLQKNANRLKAEVKELLTMTEEFAGDLSEEHFNQVRDKYDVVKNALEKLKPSF